MKTLLTILTLVLATFSGFAQKADPKSYDDLMIESRRASTTGLILVTTGPLVAAGGIGTLIYGLVKTEESYNDYYYDANGNYVEIPAEKYTTQIVVGAALSLVGIGMALSSIAFTNKANDLKREAKKLQLKTSADHIIIPGFKNNPANTGTRQYKLSLIVPLGR
jgi:hypothetical protein